MGHYRKNVLTLFLTNQCNCACKYCYLGEHHAHISKRTIDLDFARIGIQDFFSNTNSRSIRFFGNGEPTLELDLMKEIYIIAEELAENHLVSEIQTNGVFGKDVCEWLSDHITTIWISCDGSPVVQDYYRTLKNGRPTSGIVTNSISTLVRMGHKRIGVKRIGIRNTGIQ